MTALIVQAKAGGATVLFLIAQAQTKTAKVADYKVFISAQPMAKDQEKGDSTLPIGSV
ncbi:MAG: hypothetical protein P8P24_07800 [Planktomarina sp.]|nr:hypothetical protein [Planktomarina sp.]